jgi:hypothetical protein
MSHELAPDLPYKPTADIEQVGPIQGDTVDNDPGWTDYVRRIGAISLVALAALVPTASAFAAGNHKALRHHAQQVEHGGHKTGKPAHHKKHHHAHNKTFDSYGSFDSTGISPTPALQPVPVVPQPSVPPPPLQELFQYAYADADATWGISEPPCSGDVTYQSEPSNYDTSQSWVMESMWQDVVKLPNGVTSNLFNLEGPQVNPQNFSDCMMSYNNQLQPNTSTSDMANNWDYFCFAVNHEWQHFLNQYNDETPIDHGHAVEPPNSVSYPMWTGENTPASCINNAPPGVTQVTLTSQDTSGNNVWSITPPAGGTSETLTIPPGTSPILAP